MSGKITINEALNRLAVESKRHLSLLKKIEEDAEILVCGSSDSSVQIYEGLERSGLKLKYEKTSMESFPHKYTTTVCGVRFTQLSENPLEDVAL